MASRQEQQSRRSLRMSRRVVSLSASSPFYCQQPDIATAVFMPDCMAIEKRQHRRRRSVSARHTLVLRNKPILPEQRLCLSRFFFTPVVTSSRKCCRARRALRNRLWMVDRHTISCRTPFLYVIPALKQRFRISSWLPNPVFFYILYSSNRAGQSQKDGFRQPGLFCTTLENRENWFRQPAIQGSCFTLFKYLIIESPIQI